VICFHVKNFRAIVKFYQSHLFILSNLNEVHDRPETCPRGKMRYENLKAVWIIKTNLLVQKNEQRLVEQFWKVPGYSTDEFLDAFVICEH
jgi:hypothetical protein